jgi:glycosyltransferase involved in cell wall biosynthesis
MPIKIAHVNVAKAYRGGERQTELLIRALANRGMEQVLVARSDAPLASRFADIDLDIRTISGSVIGVFRETRGVDVVHVHEGRSVYGAYLRSLTSGTPYIATRRVNNPISDHYFAHRAYQRAAFVAAVAPQVGDVVRAYDSRVEVRIIHSSSSGLRSDPVATQAIRSDMPGRIVVGHIGALDNAQKAQEYIIDVARKFEKARPDLCFAIVGGGQDEAMLKQAASGLTNVVFTGFIENVGDYLAAFDIFILPSRREGIGSILLDAMDFEIPIVATRVGGVPAIVIDGHNGLLIDSDEPAQLYDAILRLADAPELRTVLGQNGRMISSRYTSATMGSKYLELYESALRSSRAQAAS